MILVTGGTGLLGSHLLYDLLQQHDAVKVLVRKSSNLNSIKETFSYYTENAETLFKKIIWVEGDILDIPSLEEAMTDVTEVYHCAAMVSFNSAEEKDMMKVNVEGTANVVNVALAKGIRKLCHVSSIAALSMHDGTEVTENTFWKASPHNTAYSISKYSSEKEVWRGMEEGLEAVIVNPSIIIGPGNWHRGSSLMFTASFKGLKFYTTGSCGFVDVRDVSKAMIALMKSGFNKERFIISAENLPFKHFFELIHDNFKKKKPYIKVGKGLGEIGWRAEKLRSLLSKREPVITRETARASNQHTVVNNIKIRKALNFEFRKIDHSVKEICTMYYVQGTR